MGFFQERSFYQTKILKGICGMTEYTHGKIHLHMNDDKALRCVSMNDHLKVVKFLTAS
jgi:hypothetical protein